MKSVVCIWFSEVCWLKYWLKSVGFVVVSLLFGILDVIGAREILAVVIGSSPIPDISLIGSVLITLGSPTIFMWLASYSLNKEPLRIGSISVCPGDISAGLRNIVCASATVCVVLEYTFPLIGGDTKVLGSFVGLTFWKIWFVTSGTDCKNWLLLALYSAGAVCDDKLFW